MLEKSQLARFWAKVLKTDGCWLWLAGLNSYGYGQFWLNGKNDLAHRVSMSGSGVDIPAGMSVLHSCDNRRCVRPDHLFIGSQATNMADMKDKGRAASGRNHGSYVSPDNFPRGEKVWTAKLTAEDVIRIREMFSAGVSYLDISHKFKIDRRHTWGIVNRRSWKHVL